MTDLHQSPGFLPGFQGFPDNTLYLTRRQVETIRRESTDPAATARLKQLQAEGRLVISHG